MASTLSILATLTIIRTTFNGLFPKEIREYFWRFIRRFSSEFTLVIEETYDGSSNHIFKAAMEYLGSHLLSVSSAEGSPKRLTVGMSENVRNFTFGLDTHSEMFDSFHGVPLKWKYHADVNTTNNNQPISESRWYELSFQKTHAEMVKRKYIPHVIDMAKRLKDRNRLVKFHTIRRERRSTNAVKLDHPMTFDTLALDGDLKNTIMEDLDSFIHGKEYYKKIGKVWKRGYLLHGPPGTGKSSLIAAMANHLNFDIYSMNLSAVNSDSALEYLLLHVSNRSILVLEDIDCTVKLQNREAGEQTVSYPHGQVTVTLSGILNAIDGLLSCCGDERIIVFTTNYKDKIDPALLRAGRMDKHICLSYCTVSTFKQLAANYLGISNHELFPRIEKIIEQINVSPADVAGELMKSKDPKTCLEGLIQFLESKASETTSDEKKLEEEGGNNRKQEKGCKIKGSTKTEMTNSDSPNPTAITFLALGSDSMPVGEYTVKAELAPILKAILLKHGNIVANCSLNSMQCRSSLLEIACGIIQKLQAVTLEDLAEPELESMLASVLDLESLKLQVSWLHKRLDEITEALRLVKHSSTLKEEKRKKLQEIEDMEKELGSCQMETPEIQKKSLQIQEMKAVLESLSQRISSNEANLSCFYQKSLVDGLL